MTAHTELGPISQQYSAAATVPLIKSPSLWLPKPVELPNDIHPIPEDITAYFVYPFTLEQHVLSLQPAPHDAIAQRRAHNAEILHQREVEEEQKEKATLHRIAPGYDPAALLVPTSASPAPASFGSILTTEHPSNAQNGRPGLLAQSTNNPSADPMDDLVTKLEEMESRR